MKAIQLISQDLFDKVRSRFTNLEMGDETGAVTIDPAEARFFDFDFVNEGVNLGRVSISLNDLGSLKIYYSQGITENQDDPSKQVWYGFLKEMRMFAMRRLLRFDTRDIAKTNLDRNDFQHLAATQAPKEEDPTMNMNESRWNQKSSKKTSRAVKGATEVIVRHHKAVDEMYPGARSQRKNIKAIYIQNRDGERFKYPFIHPAGAFAMAQHVDHGGVPHDPAGKAIVRMSEQIAQLQEFQRQVQHTSLHDDAMGITERAVGRLNELKATIEALSKRHHYESWVAELAGVDQGDDLMELDPVTMETYKAKFTETNFKEDLASFFPLIHRIMQETNTVDLEEYVSEETDICPDCKEDPCVCNTGVKEGAFSKFEEWAEATEQGKLTDDEIQALKQAMNELPNGELELGPDGQTAWQFFSGLGLSDSDLEDKFKSASELDPSADPMEVLKMWAQESYPELLVALGLSGTGQEEPAPAEPAPAEPAQPNAPAMTQEQAGGKVVVWYMIDDGEWDEKGMFDNEASAYAYIEQLAAKGYDDDNFEVLPPGQHPDDDYAYTNTNQMKEGKDTSSMVQEVAKIVKSFYNRDNPEVGPFRGNEGIALDVKKQIAEKFGEKAGEQAAQMAEQFMEKLTMEWQQRHGTPVNGDDGLARLKELVGNIKAKVEGKESHQAKTTMKHVDASDASDSEKAAIKQASKDIKPGVKGYSDRADSLKAAGIPDDRGPNEAFTTGMPHMDPKHAKAFDEVELASTLLANIRLIYKYAKTGRNPIHYIQDLKKDEDAFLSQYADDKTRKSYKFLMDNLVDGAVTAPNIIMQVADKAHEMMGHSDIDQATREGVDKSQVPAYKRKEQGGDWKMSTKDLEKEKTNSPTSSAGLARKKAELGISEELAAIKRLSGLAK